MMVFF